MSTQQAHHEPNDDLVALALRQGGLIDLTTHGRRSGRAHRIEIAFFNFDGRLYISGMPGPRDWYANLLADPSLTIHLKRGVTADFQGVARPITDSAERRDVLTRITRVWRRENQLDRFVADSPLIEVTLAPVSSETAAQPA
jgi:deazaflavin-dependent oxidoreductase (nitroreductase family)